MVYKSFFRLSLVALFLFSSMAALQTQADLYEFESAYIEKTTTTSGSGVDIIMTEKIYITEHGNKAASYQTEKRNIKKLNKVEESSSVHIVDGGWIITYDPKTKEGTKMKNALSDKFKNVSEKDAKKIAEDMKNALNAKSKDLGTETIAGKKCNVTETTSKIAGMEIIAKTWMYGNYVFKSESESFGNKVKEEVTFFKEGAKIDPEKFNIPKNVKIKQVKF